MTGRYEDNPLEYITITADDDDDDDEHDHTLEDDYDDDARLDYPFNDVESQRQAEFDDPPLW